MPERKQENQFLKLLPETVYQAWRPHLMTVDMPLGHVIYEQGLRARHIYFPLHGIVSLVYMLENGASSEIAMIGREGMVGVHQLLGQSTENHSAIVQNKGKALRLPVELVQQTFQTNHILRNLVLHYIYTLMNQIGQAAMCNRHHTVDQQVCRLLLLSLDRLNGNELLLTQELMARLLGVRREAVTLAATRLVRLGLLHYKRGQITILDRDALQERSCECYKAIAGEYRWLNGGHPTHQDAHHHVGNNIFRMA